MMTSPRIGPVLFPLLLMAAGYAQAAEADYSSGATSAFDFADSSLQAQPGDPAAAPDTVDAQVPAKKKLEFATIGYVWFAGAHGETDVIGPLPPVDLDLPFGKVLKAFKFAFMGAAEMKYDRFVALGDLTFIHLDARQGIGIRDPDFLKAELDSRTAEITLVGGYRVVDNGPMKVDLLAGGRMNWFKTNLQLEGPNREAEGEKKNNWFDPLIAGRVSAGLGGKWGFTMYGDVGGFGVGSKLTWQAWPEVTYALNKKMTLGAGWRHFKVNRRDGDFLYNVYQTGPIISFRTVM